MNRPIETFVLAIVAAVAFAGVSSAANGDFPTSWKGEYSYPKGNRPAVPFELEITSMQGGNFSGKTTEPATFGKKPCSTLYANVRGHISARSITFTKTYDGTCGENHSVHYSGSVNNGYTSMWGTWKVTKDWGGVFTAQPKAPGSSPESH
jgi:hypothetical protein